MSRGRPKDAITIVSGLPRSGTSLMMQMLHAAGVPILSDGERLADEDNPRGYLEYAPVMALRRDATWLGEARGRALKIVAPLLTSLPHDHAYQVIWMSRDLDEVLASQHRMLERAQRAKAETEESDETDTPALKRAFEAQLGKVRAELKHRDIPVLEVAYSRAVADPAATAREVCAFLNLAADEDSLAAAAATVDPALYRQRKSPKT